MYATMRLALGLVPFIAALPAHGQDSLYRIRSRDMGIEAFDLTVTETKRTRRTSVLSVPGFHDRSAAASRWLMCVYTHVAFRRGFRYWTAVYPEVPSEELLLGFPDSESEDVTQTLGPEFVKDRMLPPKSVEWYASSLCGNMSAWPAALQGPAPGALHPILDAARRGDDSQVTQILSQDRSAVDRPGPEQSTALYWAADAGHTATVEILLSAGANPSAKTGRNSTPLEVAADGGYVAIVRLLLDAGAQIDVQSKDYGSSLLMLAAVKGHASVTRMLVQRGADLELRNHQGRTALISAAANGNPEVVSILIEGGADVNATNPGNTFSSPLVAAARFQRYEAVKLLLAAGADPNQRTAGDLTPLEAAGDGEVAALIRTAISRRP